MEEGQAKGRERNDKLPPYFNSFHKFILHELERKKAKGWTGMSNHPARITH